MVSRQIDLRLPTLEEQIVDCTSDGLGLVCSGTEGSGLDSRADYGGVFHLLTARRVARNIVVFSESDPRKCGLEESSHQPPYDMPGNSHCSSSS
jgi:hypothetical protein